MRWLRFIALVIFVFLSGYAIPYTVRNPIWSNIVITIVFVGIIGGVIYFVFKSPSEGGSP